MNFGPMQVDGRRRYCDGEEDKRCIFWDSEDNEWSVVVGVATSTARTKRRVWITHRPHKGFSHPVGPIFVLDSLLAATMGRCLVGILESSDCFHGLPAVELIMHRLDIKYGKKTKWFNDRCVDSAALKELIKNEVHARTV